MGGGLFLAFELAGLPKLTNSLRVHWRVKHNESVKWKQLVKEKLSWVPPHPMKKAKITLTRCSSREPDFDGLVSGFKHVLDGLVEAGVLQNDKPSVIGQPTYLWEHAGPRAGKIKIRVEEL